MSILYLQTIKVVLIYFQFCYKIKLRIHPLNRTKLIKESHEQVYTFLKMIMCIIRRTSINLEI